MKSKKTKKPKRFYKGDDKVPKKKSEMLKEFPNCMKGCGRPSQTRVQGRALCRQCARAERQRMR